MDRNGTILSLIAVTLVSSAFIAGYLLSGWSPERRVDIAATGDTLSGNLADRFSSPDARTSPGASLSSALRAVSSERVVSPTNAPEGGILYYGEATGKVFRADLETGTTTTVSDTVLPGFLRTIWSPSKKEVISEFRSGSRTSFKYFSYVTEQSALLGGDVRSVAFSPDGTLIAYFRKNGDRGEVMLAQPDGSNPKRILSTRIPALTLEWVTHDRIVLRTDGDASGTSHLLGLTPDGDLAPLAEPARGLESRWSRDGSRALVSFYDASGALGLYLYRTDTRELSPLDVPTSASRCAWSINAAAVICGVPQSPILFGDTPSKVVTPEDIVRTTIADKMRTTLFQSSKNTPRVSVGDIVLSPLENYAVFVNAFDGKLYRLVLPPL